MTQIGAQPLPLGVHFYSPQPARFWLILSFSPHYGEVEVDPEKDVDDEDADGSLGEL